MADEQPGSSSSSSIPHADLAEGSASPVDAFPVDTPTDASPALREDQIQNAISFLSHPKVRGSAEAAKRSFLEKKGLTAAEIDEAFRRVPPEAAPAPAPVGTSSAPTVGANNLVTYTQQQQAQPAPQPVPHMASSQALVPAPPQHLQMMQPQRPPVHWAQVVLSVGVAAAGVYGLHQLLAPRLSAWSQQLFSSRKAAAEADAQRTAALTAALERLSDSQSRLQDTLESLTAAVRQQQQQRRPDQLGYAESQADYLACQSPSLGKRPHQQQQQQHYGGFGSSSYYGSAAQPGPGSVDNYGASSRAAAMRGGGNSSSWDPYAPDVSFRPASEGRPGSAASPGARTQAAGGNPSGFYGSSATGFEVTPPPMGTYKAPQPPAQYGAASSSNPAGAAPGAGGDPGYARRAGAYAGPEASSAGAPAAAGGPSSSSARPEDAPRSTAFHEVMAMVQAGITPPNVRTDIDDNPPDPNRPLSEAQMPPRSKPWEAVGTVSSNGYGTPGPAYSSNNVVADGPSGFGVRGYGGAAPAAASAAAPGGTPTSVPRVGSSLDPAADMNGHQEAAAAISTGQPGVSGQKALGYDLSQLLGSDSSRDAPWRPPPPPAATVQRPLSSGSTSNAKQPLAGAESAPAASVAEASDSQAAAPAAALPQAASAPPAAVEAVPDVLTAAVAEPPAAGVGGAALPAEAAESSA